MDWQKLAGASGNAEKMWMLFYDGEGRRRNEVLGWLTEEVYKETVERITREGEELTFASLECLLGIEEKVGQVMKKVMMHVAAWIYRQPCGEVNAQRAEKTQLREEIRTEIERKRLDGGRWTVEELSMMIEKVVVEAVAFAGEYSLVRSLLCSREDCGRLKQVEYATLMPPLGYLPCLRLCLSYLLDCLPLANSPLISAVSLSLHECAC